tara:strand:- start:121 stop:234 length:114 start_codon:yes stop_codon:yes gene_type:complete
MDCIICDVEVTHPFDIGIATVQIVDKVVCKKCFQEAE